MLDADRPAVGRIYQEGMDTDLAGFRPERPTWEEWDAPRLKNRGLVVTKDGIMQDNAASIGLHESCGLRMVGYRERIGRDGLGAWRNTVLMEKRSENRWNRPISRACGPELKFPDGFCPGHAE